MNFKTLFSFHLLVLILTSALSQNKKYFGEFQKAFQENKQTEAIAALNKAIENNEADLQYLYEVKGDAYSTFMNFEASAKAYEEVFKLNPKFNLGELYFKLGTAYYFSRNYQLASNFLEKAFKSDYKSSGIPNNLAWCFSETGNYTKALEYFQIAYDQDPNYVNNVNNLGYAYYLNDDLKKAETYILKAQDMDANNSFIYRNLGLIYMKKGKKKKACNFLQQSIDKGIIKKWGEFYINKLQEYCNN